MWRIVIKLLSFICILVLISILLPSTTTITALQAKILQVDPANFRLQIEEGINPDPLQIFISNAGGGEMLWTMTDNVDWLFSDGNGVLLAGESENRVVFVDAPLLSAGVHEGIITVTADGAQNSPVEISVTLLIEPQGITTFIVNSKDDQDDGNCTSQHCSLREAINAANEHRNDFADFPDKIHFNIGNGGVQTIVPNRPLPIITDPVTIDGTTQPGFIDSPIIELNGSNAGDDSNGLHITAGDSTIRGFVINRFLGTAGIYMVSEGNNTIQGNYVGTDVTGTRALGNALHGIHLENSGDNIIGGTSKTSRNLVAGNLSTGIFIVFPSSRNNSVQGNILGTDISGTNRLSNVEHGIVIAFGASGNLIGGTLPGAGNLIADSELDGIHIRDATNNVVQGNLIGTDITGTEVLSNGSNGIVVLENSNNNLIGGTNPEARNIISGNIGPGVAIITQSNGTIVQGNFIGTDITGTKPMGNDFGVFIFDSSDNVIGGQMDNAGNVIVANAKNGIEISGSSALRNRIEGNFIGTGLNGTTILGNGTNGVFVFNGASENVVGGNTQGTGNHIFHNEDHGVLFSVGSSRNSVKGNVISKNKFTGIWLQETSDNVIQGNLIGTDVTGSSAFGNDRRGIVILDASNNQIGGTTRETRNIIANNGDDGIHMVGENSFDNVIQGNYIGLDVSGTQPLGNGLRGVLISANAHDNLVGGTEIGAGNVISNNTSSGILIADGAMKNTVQGNLIGTDAAGTKPIGNKLNGVHIANSKENLIGGTESNSGNIISGNDFDGINLGLENGAANDNVIQGNFIGTDLGGILDLGNAIHGIFIENGSSNNLVGGENELAGNLIAFNGEGVTIADGTKNTALSNSIYSNDTIGIDLRGDGVTINDSDDADTGPNGLQNYPEIVSVMQNGNSVIISGVLNSLPNAGFTLQFFSNQVCSTNGHGEGQSLLGSADVNTNIQHAAEFSLSFPIIDDNHTFFTATATDSNGNTSEFSLCVEQ